MAEWQRDTPWRQGHQLSSEAANALGLSHGTAPDATVIVIATHDCDLAQLEEKEPAVEVVVGRAITDGELSGANTHAKEARKLHIEFGDGQWVELEAGAKTPIRKSALAEFEPVTGRLLSPDNQAVLQKWLASRYRRSAFPDEFERRLKGEAKLFNKIAKVVKPHGEHILGVFFDVDEGNEVLRDGADDTYVLDILVMHAADPDFEAAEAAASTVVKDLEAAFTAKLFTPFQRWQQVELRSCIAVSESVLTYQVFRTLKRWNLEHLSLSADPPQPALAE